MSQLLDKFSTFADRYLTWISVPNIMWTDVVEILIIAFLIYRLILWVRNTKAWSLVKGILIVLGFVLLAAVFGMTTIVWLAEKVFQFAIVAVAIVFQPELRRALEKLGNRNILKSMFSFENSKVSGELFSDRTIEEIVRASYTMGRAKTGALIVIEDKDPLGDYEKTGIKLDSVLSSQLLINIFEHNTPLHDGAVVVRGDRVMSATCYLPLSDNMALSKDLGTRHRAGVGISEVTDSLTIIVSEETGKVSLAKDGILYSNVDPDLMRQMLVKLQDKVVEENKLLFWKGWSRHEKNSDK